MSKRVQTNVLKLYQYYNERGLPTFLTDWSENMTILDNAHQTILDTISAIDERLGNAEETLSDLSPESIEDYKIRLNALEKKVSINVNTIKLLNTKIDSINTNISTINAEQLVQNNRLTALESVTEGHSSLINDTISDLDALSGRVTNLEACCETVQHEITDLQNDVNGFNEDIEIIAGEVDTLSEIVNNFVNLVNTLSDKIDAKQDKLIAGDGIIIEDNVISATGGGRVIASYDASTENITLS